MGSHTGGEHIALALALTLALEIVHTPREEEAIHIGGHGAAHT